MIRECDNLSPEPVIRVRRPKRGLAVRMLLARVAWLDRPLRWHEGKIVWGSADDFVAPDAAELSRTQRSLYKIVQYPVAASKILGDTEPWLAHRQQQLELAKHLSSLRASDMVGFIENARHGNASDIQTLVSLLQAEALCLNALLHSPSHALVAVGETSRLPLRGLIDSQSMTESVRSLAALTLGAIDRKFGLTQYPALQTEWIKRAYHWGSTQNLPSDPALIIRLLADSNGVDITHRFLTATANDSLIALDINLMREMLYEGIAPEQIAQIAEAVVEVDAPLKKLMFYRHLLPDCYQTRYRTRDRENRVRTAVYCRETNEAHLKALDTAIHKYMRITRDKRIVTLIALFLEKMADLTTEPHLFLETSVQAMTSGTHLPDTLQLGYLELLTDHHQTLWDTREIPDGNPETIRTCIQSWLINQPAQIKKLRDALELTKDIGLVRDAINLKTLSIFRCHSSNDAALYRYAFTIVQYFKQEDNADVIEGVCDLLCRCRNLAEGRTLVQPIINALQSSPSESRSEIFVAIMENAHGRRVDILASLTGISSDIPLLLEFASQVSTPDLLAHCVQVWMEMRRRGRPSQVYLQVLLAHILSLDDDQRNLCHTNLTRAASFAFVLSSDRIDLFQTLFPVALLHVANWEWYPLEASLELLGRYTGLSKPRGQSYAAQPKRCLDLLIQLSSATRLGPQSTARLSTLNAKMLPEFPVILCANANWRRVTMIAPELTDQVLRYQRAQALLGQSPDAPPGIVKALERPEKIAQERKHIEQVLLEAPDRTDLLKRAVKLREQLEDTETLLREMRADIAERLSHILIDTELSAAEHVVAQCFRDRITSVTGPIPNDCLMTRDLMNAALLSAAIHTNRRLLSRLLRASVDGDKNWVETHPDNIAFLKSLEARGVDTQIWTFEFPKRFELSGAVGGFVHLRIETDPLHILQMGNYFGTCLSTNDCNAYSTVANACEINKRVIYARDGAHNVVGRKLIGVTDKNALVGFHTYSSLNTSEDTEALSQIMQQYAQDFAKCCRLPLADEGNVPTLFAEAWYDDGTEPWKRDKCSILSCHENSQSLHAKIRQNGLSRQRVCGIL